MMVPSSKHVTKKTAPAHQAGADRVASVPTDKRSRIPEIPSRAVGQRRQLRGSRAGGCERGERLSSCCLWSPKSNLDRAPPKSAASNPQRQ